MFDYKNADIKFKITSKSVVESNQILRKFYDELSKSFKMGWCYQFAKKEKVIFVGTSNFGEMWLDYKERGLIDHIYVSTANEKNHAIVENALKEARDHHDDFVTYHVRIKFITKEISFSSMCRKDIILESSLNEEGDYISTITFSVRAFGKSDLEYVITQKMNYLRHLLCAYTNMQFDMLFEVGLIQNITYEENEWSDYDMDWMDRFYNEDREPVDTNLIPDFFDIFRMILDYDSYEKDIRLLLNSAQEIYCGKLMTNDISKDPKYRIPGYVDMADTMMISALEALSNIGAGKPERCPECGNLKFKIRKKVEELCIKYLPEFLAMEISKKAYGRRSAFLHEGNARTNEFYCGRCVPLIDPDTKNTMLYASAFSDINLFEYTTYLFRQVVHDFLCASDESTSVT